MKKKTIEIMSPTGSWESLQAAIIAFLFKRLNFKILKFVVLNTINVSIYIFAIFVGATIFALVLRLCGGDELIEFGLTGMGFGPYGLIIFFVSVVFLLGFQLLLMETGKLQNKI